MKSRVSSPKNTQDIENLFEDEKNIENIFYSNGSTNENLKSSFYASIFKYKL
jgi:hypothetical protein